MAARQRTNILFDWRSSMQLNIRTSGGIYVLLTQQLFCNIVIDYQTDERAYADCTSRYELAIARL